MRLFIAIMLSDDMKKAVTGTMHELKKADVRGSYVPAQNLHVTLAFIGETKDASAVKTAMQTLSCKPFRMAFAEMGVFDNLLWVGIKGNQGLNKLAKYVGTALDEAQIPYDRKKFVPHVTIIRNMGGPWKKVSPPKADMTVKKVSLMKSEQKNGKQVYTEIFSVDLGGKA
jgi:2'-5' RNA ligase